MARRATVDEKDKACIAALERYRASPNQHDRDLVFGYIHNVCYAVCKRLLGAVRTRDFSGKVLDATCAVMKRLDRNGPKDTPRGKLSTFVYCYCNKALYDPHIINEEKQVRMDNITNASFVGWGYVLSEEEQGEIDEFISKEDGEELEGEESSGVSTGYVQ